jgi:hypothetical protein
VGASVKNGMLKTIAVCLTALLLPILTNCTAVLEFLRLSKKEDPNAYPAAYRTDLLDYLKRNPTEMGSARNTFISAPSMKPFGSESRYFVCVKANDDGAQVQKVAVFLAGKIIQFVDAGEECGRAFYQPFPELAAMFAQAAGKK